MIINIEDMTDAELRQVAEEGIKTISPIVRMVASAPEGSFACPMCCGTAYWTRRAREWSADCGCGWNAAGMLSAKAVAN